MKNNPYYIDEEQTEKNSLFSPSTPFGEYAVHWINNNKNRLAPKTYSRYVSLLTRINQGIGHISLNKLHPCHIAAFSEKLALPGINKRNGKELSSKTILHHLRLISVILSDAVRENILDSNVCCNNYVRMPKCSSKELQIISLEEIRTLLNYVENEHNIKIAVAVLIALFAGLRRGEIAALQWKDIDLHNRLITVRQSVCYTTERGTLVKSPKTEFSYRIVPFSEDILLSKLGKYKALYSTQFGTAGKTMYLFPSITSCYNPIHPDTITGWMTKIRNKLQMDALTVQSLRHTYVSLQIANNTPIKDISQMLVTLSSQQLVIFTLIRYGDTILFIPKA